MALQFNAQAWQGLKVFFDWEFRLLYGVFAYTSVRKAINYSML